jgi:tripartite-type tricarboxylate transporter receptor subunit TctC
MSRRNTSNACGTASRRWILATQMCAIPSVLALCSGSFAHAQDYPAAKPLRILTSQPGSGSDIVARIISDRLPATFGQRAIVDNRGILAPEIAVKAPADGYTVLFYSTPLWVSPLMRSNVPWDAMRDFAPVTLAVNAPNLLVVHPSLPVKTVKELIALTKTRSGELNYGSGSAGSTSHLAAELFNATAGVDIVRIPYKGVGPALLGLLGGHVQVMFPSASSVLPYMKMGKVRALAIASAKPSPLAPGLTTMAAAGLPGYEADTPLGVFVPAATPPRIVKRLHRALVAVLENPETRNLVIAQGSDVVASSPAEFAATLKAEIARWGKLIKAKGLKEE